MHGALLSLLLPRIMIDGRTDSLKYFVYDINAWCIIIILFPRVKINGRTDSLKYFIYGISAWILLLLLLYYNSLVLSLKEQQIPYDIFYKIHQ